MILHSHTWCNIGVYLYGRHTITITCLMGNTNLALLQMRSTLIDEEVSSPTTLLLNRTIRALLPQMNMGPINFNADDECHEALKTLREIY